MSKRRIILATLIPLLILVGIVAIKLWAGEEIVAIPENPVASATASPTKAWVDTAISFDGSGSKDMDTKITWEETEEGYKYNFQRFPIAGTVEKWEWKFGDGDTGVGKITTHTYTKPDVSTDGHKVELTITADHNETAEATTSVRIWPKVGEITITSTLEPLHIGYAGEEYTFTAHVKDTHDNDWEGAEYPPLTYLWWHCGMSVSNISGGKSQSFTFNPSFPGDNYEIRAYADFPRPTGGTPRRVYSDLYGIVIWSFNFNPPKR